MLRLASLAAAAASLALVAACGDGASSSAPDLPALKVHVEASEADVALMVRTPTAPYGDRGGTSRQLDADVSNPNGKVLEHKQHVAWSSTDTLVATVDSTGLVTAQGVGAALVIVDHKKGADTVSVSVTPVPVASVSLAGPDSLSVDDSASYHAEALDSVGVPLAGREIAWASSAPEVASVSGAGDVVALAVGTTSVGASSEGKSASVALRVWPQPVATVEVTPAASSLPQFHKLAFAATLRDRRGKVLTDRAVAWTSSDAAAIAVVAVGATTGAGVAKDVGAATVTATAEGKSGDAAVTVTNPVEARALWVTRFEFTTASAVDFNKIAQIFAKAASAHFNVVYFQVRTSGDALYFSDLEPCSPRMCGRLGGPRPAQDPLAVALAEAAKYGIEVHAWVNAMTGFISGSSTACNQFVASTPANWLKAHPEWSVSTKNFSTGALTRQVDNCLTSSEYMYVSPGIPEVRAQLARVTADLARRYGPKGLRGIHLDRIRYSANNLSYDQPSQDAYKAQYGTFPTSNASATWLDFRRGFVNQAVREVRDSVAAVDARMVISAAVWPGYKPRSGWAATWSFTDLFQDPQAWAQAGTLDVEVPMTYPATATSTSWIPKATYCSNVDWTCAMDDHIERIERQSGRQVYVGVGAIRGWPDMAAELDLAHDRVATGVSVYSFSLVDAIPNAWAMLAAGPFKNPATIPAMPWK